MKSLHDDATARTVLINNLRWVDCWARRLAEMMAEARGFTGCAESRRHNKIDPTPLTYADLDKLRDGLAAVRQDLAGLLQVDGDPAANAIPHDSQSRARALGLVVIHGGRSDPPAAA